MSTAASGISRWYQLSGHVLLRYGSAHLVDPVSATLQIQEDLATARVIASEEEACEFLGGRLRFRSGHQYLAGVAGIYVIRNNRAITYISNSKRFRGRTVRGAVQQSRGGRLHTYPHTSRRTTKEPI